MSKEKVRELLHACMEMRTQLGLLFSTGDLTRGEYLALGMLARSRREPGGEAAGESVRAAGLSDELGMKRPLVSRILNALEERGLIVRTIDEKNRRSFEITLTEMGAAAYMKAEAAVSGVVHRLHEALGEEDTDTLIELLGRITGVYRKLTAERLEAKRPEGEEK